MVRSPVEVDSREIYHSLCPLPYLSPIPKEDIPGTVTEQAENEVAYRQLLVQGVLAVLLPTEDLQNDCLTSLVGQILSELIIGGVVVKKASEPWMIWTGLTILADVLGRNKADNPGQATPRKGSLPPKTHTFSISELFWSLLHYIFLLTTLVRSFITTVATCRSVPPRSQRLVTNNDELAHLKKDGMQSLDTSTSISPFPPSTDSTKTPILAFGIWPTISNLIGVDRRMPWLLGSLSMVQWLAIAGPGRMAGFDGVIDR